MMETKQCSGCKEVKSTGEFYANNHRKDGFENQCKECKKKSGRRFPKQCETCKEPFLANNKNAKFCSLECKRFEKNCPNCHKSFITASITGKYCSEECKIDFVIIRNEKKCGKCGITKNINEFRKERGAPDGRRSHCKECDNKKARAKRQEKKLKEYMESIGYEETDKTIPAEIDLNQLKACTVCKVDKSLSEFRPVYVKKKFNRFHAHCKECASIKNKEYRLESEMKRYRKMHREGQEMLKKIKEELKNKGEI